VSDHTAKFHVNRILDKLDATTRTEAVVRAARTGLLLL
jgi:DNA-binding CsgD family transcriptional regulator